MWSDASGSWGCGAVWGKYWFQVPWSTFTTVNSNIAVLELLPVVLAAAVWGSNWRGAVVQFNCGSEAVVAVLNAGTAK